MFSPPRLTTTLPANTEVHLRVRWRRSILGLPLPAPRITVDNRHTPID